MFPKTNLRNTPLPTSEASKVSFWWTNAGSPDPLRSGSACVSSIPLVMGLLRFTTACKGRHYIKWDAAPNRRHFPNCSYQFCCRVWIWEFVLRLKVGAGKPRHHAWPCYNEVSVAVRAITKQIYFILVGSIVGLPTTFSFYADRFSTHPSITNP